MKFNIDIDEGILCELDQAAQAHNITRNTAVRGAITAWLSQARRDAALLAMFETESDSASTEEDRSSSEQSSESPNTHTRRSGRR
jgi:hypothetical protein